MKKLLILCVLFSLSLVASVMTLSMMDISMSISTFTYYLKSSGIIIVGPPLIIYNFIYLLVTDGGNNYFYLFIGVVIGIVSICSYFLYRNIKKLFLGGEEDSVGKMVKQYSIIFLCMYFWFLVGGFIPGMERI